MTTSEHGDQEDQIEFKLKSQSAKFSEKNDSIFSSLSLLEKKHAAYEKVRSHKGEKELMKPDPVVDSMIDDRDRPGYRGRGRGRGRRHQPYVPMYRREPKKWTMYDLSDVDPASMSDRSNKAAALSFLADLKKRKSNKDLDEKPVTNDVKVLFKKPVSSQTPKPKQTQEESEGSTSCGKLIMPEYNFGAKKEKPQKKTGQIAAGAGIQLSHLDDENDV